ncbi:hypothetical protein SNEBB_009239 [Seison nebaliae]|nr:hypothetical protein SNEBB_009239 [Seison nebaliae]
MESFFFILLIDLVLSRNTKFFSYSPWSPWMHAFLPDIQRTVKCMTFTRVRLCLNYGHHRRTKRCHPHYQIIQYDTINHKMCDIAEASPYNRKCQMLFRHKYVVQAKRTLIDKVKNRMNLFRDVHTADDRLVVNDEFSPVILTRHGKSRSKLSNIRF